MLTMELKESALLCLVLFGVVSTCIGDPTLVATSMVYRHGDRAPELAYPLDRFNESFWPYGWGQLTDIGKGQQYRLGKLLRTRYDSLLKDVYWYENIAVRSSHIDRCLISAYSNLAGIYSNSTEREDLELPFVNWQPVPVHSISTELDDLIAMSRSCPKADKITVGQLFGPDVQQINRDYADFFKYITEHTGVNTSTNGFLETLLPADNLFCEQAHGEPLPVWALKKGTTCNNNKQIPCEGKTVFEIMTDMASYMFYIMYEPASIHPFRGGPLLIDIQVKFDSFAAGNRTIAFNMYSGHDTTVAATLSALNVFDGTRPPYAACIIFDLLIDDSGEYIVAVSYRNVTDDTTVYPLELPDCPSPCTLKSFGKMLGDYQIGDWDEACTTTPPSSGGLSLVAIIIICSVCAVVINTVVVIACLCYLKRRRGLFSRLRDELS